MPRKSAAALAAEIGLKVHDLHPRPEPPYGLPPAASALWQRIVNEQPADYFRVATLPLLSAYCLHACTLDQLAKLIAETDPEVDLSRFDQLLRMRKRESAALASLSTKLRLAQSQRFDSRKKLEPRPWVPPWERHK
jgi:hypothetical protein